MVETTTAATRFPNYLEMRQTLPLWVWHAVRAVVVAGALGLIATLFIAPRTGLIAWWLFVLPVIPMLLMLAPGIWRNVCPMATVNQYPRLFGFTRGRTVPAWLTRRTILIQAGLYFLLISTRAPLFDHDGRAVGVLMALALALACLGGVVFKGKSGWCGTFCPLMPIQRLYGQTPAVVVPNSHCATCVGCTPNCLDFNPRLAVVADVHEADQFRLSQLELFAGTFPGFVVAFFTVPNSIVGASADIGIGVMRFYVLTIVYMLVSLGGFFLLKAFTPLTPLVLMAAFGALGLNLHNILRFPTAFHVAKPAWVLAIEYVVVAALTVQFVVRTHRNERTVARVFGEPSAASAIRPGAGAERLRRGEDDGHEVAFEPDGPRIVADDGTSLLELAERAALPIESGCRMGVCGADPIAVLAGMDHLSPAGMAERSTLGRLGLGEGCRMACMARVTGPVRVTLDVTATEPGAPTSIDFDFDRAVEHVVIIGAGVAGCTAADHVRRRHPTCTIDVVSDELHAPYNRMAISRLVYGRGAMSGLRLVPEDWFERIDATCWLNTQVHEIDRDRRVVVLGTGERLPYDRLILATGAIAWRPPLAGLDHPGVFVLRSVEDATAIRSFAQRHQARRAVVAGGGLLGLEAAHALHRFGLRVTVIQRSQQLLPRELDARAAELLERYLTGLGIAVVTGRSPTAMEWEGTPKLVLDDDTRIPTDICLLCTGVKPDTALAVRAGLAVDRGIVVDRGMRTGDPAIFAAGDSAQLEGSASGLWPVAVAQAEVAATNAVGGSAEYDPPPVTTILKGVGLDLVSVGVVAAATGDEVLDHQAGGDEIRYVRLVVRDDRLVGAVLLGHWAESADVVDAVATGADVSGVLDDLRAGDLTTVAGAVRLA